MEELFKSCFNKQESVKELFNSSPTPESKYQKLIELGKSLPPLDPNSRTPEMIVQGCQSLVYLRSFCHDGRIFFQAESEALISSGLAYLLIAVYNGELPEVILKCPPSFIEDLGLSTSLTPGRSNGLASIYLRMKQDALNFITKGLI